MKAKFFSCLVSILILSNISALGQEISVLTPSLDDFYRRAQLLNKLDSCVSFTVRPLNSNLAQISDSDSLWSFVSSPISGRQNNFQILPLVWQNKYNSHHPYGFNDGGMIPAKGYQTMISGGFFAKYGPLSIQLRPEFVFAANSSFDQFQSHMGPTDLPERFGSDPYSKLFWGQSNVSITLGSMSLGLSSENLWWGPGMRNSLLMSNNAPGFKHLTLNTSRPADIGIGSIEGQIVAGRLEGSGLTSGLRDDWRYFSGMVLSYNPKWVPGLFVGLTRAFQQYGGEQRKFGDYFPVFQPFQKKNTKEDQVERDQLTSIFARWMLTKSKSEVYFEYGLNDHSYNLRDFIADPEHSRAYTMGFRKLVPLSKRYWEYMSLGFELTHMEQSIDRTLREAGEWYTHGQVHHGYTNQGQVLGAGIGPGGNFQSMDISWYKGMRRVGLQLERFEHNGDYANVLNRGQWIDYSAGIVTDWEYKKLLFNGKLQGIQCNNYQWNSGIGGTSEQDIFNLNIQLGISYNF